MRLRIRKLTVEEAKSIAEEYDFRISKADFPAYWDLIQAALASYDKLDSLSEPKLKPGRPLQRGHRPSRSENTLGAWAWRCSIKGRTSGPLRGKKIAIKDNVSVAGLPLSNGSYVLQGYVPDIDATVVSRIIRAGGEIAGKATCEDMCVSGGSDTSYPAPVLNPHDHRYMAGGSSSGSAALVASGEVEMAIGGDQAGSIRIPSSWCGVFGLKPTWGLVPYTGIFPIEPSIDHAGPIASSASDLALLLQAIAGRDGLDPRQVNTPFEIPSYTQHLEDGIRGLKIGVVEEGFGWEGISEKDVDKTVRDSFSKFENAGAIVKQVSIPMHREGVHVWTGIAVEGAWNTMIRDEGVAHGLPGYYDTHLVEFYNRSRRARSADLPGTLKMIAIVAEHLNRKYHGKYYSKAQNLRRRLREAYDQELKHFDLLLMPTTVQKAQRFKPGTLAYSFKTAFNTLLNTCPFDVTGHPALNVPCGYSQTGLPIGMMMIGRYFDEPTLLKAAFAFEKNATEGRPMH